MDLRETVMSRCTTTLASLLALAAFDPALAESAAPPATTSIPSAAYTPGDRYHGANDWIEYHAGNLPVIISAPHGGRLTPSSIPDRSKSACGGNFTTVTDKNTAQLALDLRDAFHDYTGRYPHVIINRLKRTKLDSNRNRSNGACGNSDAETAWADFHGFIEVAKNQALGSAWERGWYIDVHGWRGSNVALGYRLSAADLRKDDATLDSEPEYLEKSTFRTFAANSPLPFASVLLRGEHAIGTQLARDGYPSIPSQQTYAPAARKKHFQGGYNVITHGCQGGGNVCGVQVEAPFGGIRDTRGNRKAFSASLVRATDAFLRHNFEFSLRSRDDLSAR